MSRSNVPPNTALQRTSPAAPAPPLSLKALGAAISCGRLPTDTGQRALRAFALLVGLASLHGCISIKITYLDPGYRPAARAASVQFLREEPLQPYKVVARFQFQDKGWNFSKDQVEQRIKNEAGRLGGEAVVVEQRVQNHFVSEGLLVGHTAEVSQLVIYAKVIVFGETGAR